MAIQIQLRRDTAANWTANDPTLANGEIGLETDTSKMKIGDGSTAWTSLAYFTGGLQNVVEDTTPQLGGDLDAQTKRIYDVKVLDFKAPTELTIAAGAITVTQTFHTVDTEADAATDDLDTINGGSDGRLIVIKAVNDARTVVVKHNTGNIWLQGKADISLDDISDGLMLVYSATDSKWFDIAAGGGGGGSSTWLGLTDTASSFSGKAGQVPTVNAGENALEFALTPKNTAMARAYRDAFQNDVPDSLISRIDLNAEDYDPGSNFDVSSWLTGNADQNELNKLHDADGGFSKALVGVRVQNTNSLDYAYVTAFVDSGELTLNADIFPNGNEPYEFVHAKYTAPVAGYYLICCNLAFTSVVADKRVMLVVSKNPGDGADTNADRLLMCAYHTSSADAIYGAMSSVVHLAASDIIELRCDQRCGVDTVDVFGGAVPGTAGALTFMDITLFQAD